MGTIDTKNKLERVVLVGLIQRGQTPELVYEHLAELKFLAETAGAETIRNFVQRLDMPNNKTFVGKGKLEEIDNYVRTNNIQIVIFDDELSPSQLRNIEKILERKVLDRNNLILDIFANRAQTANAKAQVELARLQYSLPRLKRLWTHLDRQKGGIGMRGDGETQMETDRRIIKDKIAKLQEKLKKIDKQTRVQRGNRARMIRVALVGYTNVGKSTTMNLLCKSDIFAENKLFATLDTTVRKLVIDNVPFLLSDTVGFIRKLPHLLVDSFKSTLDEVREADLLLHIIDITHPAFEDQLNTVNETLADIGVTDKPTILVFNKIDGYEALGGFEEGEFSRPKLDALEKTWMAKMNNNCIFISAVEKTNIDVFKKMLYDEVKKLHIKRFPYNNFLYQDYEEE